MFDTDTSISQVVVVFFFHWLEVEWGTYEENHDCLYVLFFGTLDFEGQF